MISNMQVSCKEKITEKMQDFCSTYDHSFKNPIFKICFGKEFEKHFVTVTEMYKVIIFTLKFVACILDPM